MAKFMQKIAYVCLLSVFTVSLQAKLADHFMKSGNEKASVQDAVSHKTVTFLTSGDYINSSQYPHNKAWLENDKYVMFESLRPRPDGQPSTGDNSDYRHTERQLMAADVESSDLYWLASLEVEDTTQYGSYHLSMSSMYHTDYAPASNSVVYYDMSGHNLYMLSLNTGERKLIYNAANGTIGDPPTISDDGTRVVVYIAHPGPANSTLFAGRTTSIVYFDIDPQTNDVIGEPVTVYTYAYKKYPTEAVPNNSISLSHAVINPSDKDEMSFCHGYAGYADGSVEMARVWYLKMDGSEMRMACPTPVDHIHTHEVWSAKGNIYFVDIKGTGGISSVNPGTGEVKRLIDGINPRCLHISVSEDEKRIVFDTQSSTPLDENLNHLESIGFFDVESGQVRVLARQMEGKDHPRHMHPLITRKGDKVCFTVADGSNSKIAVVDID